MNSINKNSKAKKSKDKNLISDCSFKEENDLRSLCKSKSNKSTNLTLYKDCENENKSKEMKNNADENKIIIFNSEENRPSVKKSYKENTSKGKMSEGNNDNGFNKANIGSNMSFKSFNLKDNALIANNIKNNQLSTGKKRKDLHIKITNSPRESNILTFPSKDATKDSLTLRENESFNYSNTNKRFIFFKDKEDSKDDKSTTANTYNSSLYNRRDFDNYLYCKSPISSTISNKEYNYAKKPDSEADRAFSFKSGSFKHEVNDENNQSLFKQSSSSSWKQFKAEDNTSLFASPNAKNNESVAISKNHKTQNRHLNDYSYNITRQNSGYKSDNQDFDNHKFLSRKRFSSDCSLESNQNSNCSNELYNLMKIQENKESNYSNSNAIDDFLTEHKI